MGIKENMAKKNKTRSFTVEAIGYALDTLDVGSDELLNLFHEAEGKEYSKDLEYKYWLCKKILEDSLKEDNIPLSQYKLKWAQFMAELSGDFSLDSKVSKDLMGKVLGILPESFYSSMGGFEDLESLNSQEIEWDWEGDEATPDWLGKVDLFEHIAEELPEDVNNLVVCAWLEHKKPKKTDVVKTLRKELGSLDCTSGEMKLYQLSAGAERGTSIENSLYLESVNLVLHNDVNFWQRCNNTILDFFLTHYELVDVLGEFTPQHIFQSAPFQKPQLVTVWKLKGTDKREKGVVEITYEGKTYLTNGTNNADELSIENISVENFENVLAKKGIGILEKTLGKAESGILPPNGLEDWGKLVVNGFVLCLVEGVIPEKLKALVNSFNVETKYELLLTVEGKQLLQHIREEVLLSDKVYDNKKMILLNEHKNLCVENNLIEL